jgi:hypothetical protein
MDTGEFPGYEFDVPRGPRRITGHDSLPELRYVPQHAQAPESRSPVLAAGSGVLAVMRNRNWLLGLAMPILAAIAVGIAAVVISGGSGGSGAAPSALAAGYPPARLAGADFTGTPASTAGAARVALAAVGASAGTEVAAGGADGGPALWVSADGGTTWSRAALAGPALLTAAGTGLLAGVAHGPAGWLAVGTTRARAGGPLVASSADGRSWTVTAAIPGSGGANAVASAVAAGHGGYVIVGHRPGGPDGAPVAAAWYAPGPAGWRNAAVGAQAAGAADHAQAAGADQEMNAVTATRAGFTAVGASGVQPAAWLSAAGRSWRQVPLPMPDGAARAALDYVATAGAAIVAAGTEFTAGGASRPFTEVSADAGATWTAVPLPVPGIGPGTGTTVTALTAAGGGFTATGTYVTKAGPEVVVWTLPPGTAVTSGSGWGAVTPQGTGLSSANAENTITALTADGVTLTGVGFTASLTASGTPGAQQPTLWQSPIRY